jgi:hypothetical protein
MFVELVKRSSQVSNHRNHPRDIQTTAVPSRFAEFINKVRPEVKEVDVHAVSAKIAEASNIYAKKSSLEPFHLLDVRYVRVRLCRCVLSAGAGALCV